MIELFHEAQALQRFLLDRGWPFCFIGGVALQHWGEPRVTRDLDLTVFTGFGGEAAVVDGLLARYRGRRADTREFALRHRVVLVSTPAGLPSPPASSRWRRRKGIPRFRSGCTSCGSTSSAKRG